MFGRVLVATDLTGSTRASLRAALDLVQREDGEVLLFHVIRNIPGLADGELRGFYERLKSSAQTRMLELTRWFTDQRGVEIACEIAMGQPAREIVRAAQKHHVDMIVLAHAEGNAPLGSVSYKVVQQAKCAVLVLRGPAEAHVLADSEQRSPRRPAAGSPTAADNRERHAAISSSIRHDSIRRSGGGHRSRR